MSRDPIVRKEWLSLDPTARGDLVASRVRRWYEANRETWWDRNKPGLIGSAPDRTGEHADEFILRFIAAVHDAERAIEEVYG